MARLSASGTSSRTKGGKNNLARVSRCERYAYKKRRSAIVVVPSRRLNTVDLKAIRGDNAKTRISQGQEDEAKQNRNRSIEWQNSIPSTSSLAACAVALSLAVSSICPDEALAARSGGRMGGRSFRSAPRAAPRAARPRASSGGGGLGSGGVYVAPPLYGYGGYGGYGGFYGGPSFFSPGLAFAAPGLFSLIFNMMLIAFAVNFLSSVVKSFKGDNDDVSDDFDDEDKW